MGALYKDGGGFRGRGCWLHLRVAIVELSRCVVPGILGSFCCAHALMTFLAVECFRGVRKASK